MNGTRHITGLAHTLMALRGEGLHHARSGQALQPVAHVDGVDYFDDSRSTFLDAALFSLLDIGGPLVWIASAQVLPALDDRLEAFLREHVQAIVFYGPAPVAQVDALHAKLGQVYAAENLRIAVFAARELAQPGSKVLFSPASPCQGEAANHAERGAGFRLAVSDL